MKQSLQLRTSQHLALTPQLQQSIRLLQLSTLELHQELEQILADNPLLERLDDPLDHSVRLLSDGSVAPGVSATAPEGAGSQEPGSDSDGAAADNAFDGADGGDASGGNEGSTDSDWSF